MRSTGFADERFGAVADAFAPVSSCAKAIVSLSVHLLAPEGRLDLDAPAAAYWPEFAQAGKERITGRMVLGIAPAFRRTTDS
jgi:CubicO group peptidase (beta-lactamase class C family)